MVGVNEYKVDEPLKYEILKIDPKKEEDQVKGLVDIRKKRDNAAVKSALAEVKKAAEGKDNLMPPILKAVKAYGTIGEISDTLRSIFGEYREKV